MENHFSVGGDNLQDLVWVKLVAFVVLRDKRLKKNAQFTAA